MNRNKIGIILPGRIGDGILSLPAILCLKQLYSMYNPEKPDITILQLPYMAKIISSFDLFDVEKINTVSKIKSWIINFDKLFHLYDSSKNIGYRANKTYGLKTGKWYLNYCVNSAYLNNKNTKKELPESLTNFLEENYQFSISVIGYFGLCLDFGYSVEQIKTAFKFDCNSSLNPIKEFSNRNFSFIKSDYIVICMEAAYGKKVEAKRRWSEENFIKLAEEIYNNFGLTSVFIGVDNKYKIPAKSYFIDLRKKLNLAGTAQSLKLSKGFIGNDSGPLHLANLIKKHSVCITLIDVTNNYKPIFKEFCHFVWNPQTSGEVISVLEKIF